MSPTPDPRIAARSQLIRLLAERLVRDALASVRSEVSRNERGVRARLGELTKEIDNLVGSIAIVGISPAIAARLKAAEAEKATIEAQLASNSPSAASAAVDNVMGRYKALLLNLTDALSAETDREHTRRLLGELIGTVVVGRDEEGAYAEMTEPAERLLVAAGGGFVDNRGCGGAILRLSTRRIRL